MLQQIQAIDGLQTSYCHGPGFHSSMNHTIRPRRPPRYPQHCAISSTSPSP